MGRVGGEIDVLLCDLFGIIFFFFAQTLLKAMNKVSSHLCEICARWTLSKQLIRHWDCFLSRHAVDNLGVVVTKIIFIPLALAISNQNYK